jgi:hypothetical protein
LKLYKYLWKIKVEEGASRRERRERKIG